MPLIFETETSTCKFCKNVSSNNTYCTRCRGVVCDKCCLHDPFDRMLKLWFVVDDKEQEIVELDLPTLREAKEALCEHLNIANLNIQRLEKGLYQYKNFYIGTGKVISSKGVDLEAMGY